MTTLAIRSIRISPALVRAAPAVSIAPAFVALREGLQEAAEMVVMVSPILATAFGIIWALALKGFL